MTAACKKEHRPEEDPASFIMLSATEAGSNSHLKNGTFNPTPGTKALLDADKFATSGNRIQIYDFVTDGTTTTKHIDDQIGPELSSNSPMHSPGYTWPFVNGPHQWCPGSHKFFGWLVKDANMTASNSPTSFFGSGFAFENFLLTIPQVSFTKDTPQFDFMYSNIYTTEPINTPVPLEFSHLFSAFYITALNRDSENAVRVKEIKLNNLNTSKSAQINFTGNTTAVTYIDSGVSTSFSFTYAGELLSTTAKTISDKYMIWPQTADDFSDATLFIRYDYTSEGQTKEQERTIPLSSITEWNAGVVNSINIVIDVDQITFYINSLEDWNAEEKDIVVEM